MEYRKLGDICDVVSGGTPSRSKPEYWDGDIPWIKIGNIKGKYVSEADEFITEEGLAGSSAKMLSKGTILYTIFATLGEAGVLTIDACTNQAIAGITIKNDDIIDRDYLYYYLKSKKNYVNDIGRGVAQNNINMSILRGFEVPIREIFEQQTITDILDKIGKIIDLRKEELDRFDELIKARFVELFGDPKINEKNWNTGIVSQFYEVKGGKRIPKGMGYADGITAHPYLRATDMKNETILDDDIHYIDEAVFEKIKRYTVNGGDIYLTNVGVNLGMAGVIPNKYDGANLTENAVKLVPKTDGVLDGIFLAHYINSPGIQDYINERKMSVGVPKLAIFRIETMPLIIPPMNLQIEFINFCKQVDKSKVVDIKAA